MQLEEQGGATATQIDMNRKREAELTQLRVDMASQSEEHEKMVGDLRKKQALAMGELEENVATLQKSKAKLEKEVHRVNAELMDANEQLDEVQKLKVSWSFHGDNTLFSLDLACKNVAILLFLFPSRMSAASSLK